jgi:hypothetical protein
MSVPTPAHTVAQLMRPGGAPRSVDVPAEDREHAATVVAHLLHRDCVQWSWTEHHADTHRPEARRIVGALCREGWTPDGR